jgi:uncharacterized membrane protein
MNKGTIAIVVVLVVITISVFYFLSKRNKNVTTQVDLNTLSSGKLI